MNYTRENENQMGGAHKTVNFKYELSEKQINALRQKQSKIEGLDTHEGLPLALSIEGSVVLYWGNRSVEDQIRSIVEKNK